jgi:hypothetical protein
VHDVHGVAFQLGPVEREPLHGQELDERDALVVVHVDRGDVRLWEKKGRKKRIHC